MSLPNVLFEETVEPLHVGSRYGSWETHVWFSFNLSRCEQAPPQAPTATIDQTLLRHHSLPPVNWAKQTLLPSNGFCKMLSYWQEDNQYDI